MLCWCLNDIGGNFHVDDRTTKSVTNILYWYEFISSEKSVINTVTNISGYEVHCSCHLCLYGWNIFVFKPKNVAEKSEDLPLRTLSLKLRFPNFKGRVPSGNFAHALESVSCVTCLICHIWRLRLTPPALVVFWASRFEIIFMVLGVSRTLETENDSSKNLKSRNFFEKIFFFFDFTYTFKKYRILRFWLKA